MIWIYSQWFIWRRGGRRAQTNFRVGRMISTMGRLCQTDNRLATLRGAVPRTKSKGSSFTGPMAERMWT
jgi:hypothetical protein